MNFGESMKLTSYTNITLPIWEHDTGSPLYELLISFSCKNVKSKSKKKKKENLRVSCVIP